MIEKEKVSKFLLWLGSLLMLVVSIVLLWKTNQKRLINAGNILVSVEIVEAPNKCSNIGKRGGYCTLKYNSKTFVKRAGNKFCHLVSGKMNLKMLTNKERNTFIFVGEYESAQFLYGGFLFMIGLIIMIKIFYN
ncbi:hypothetical protein [Sinomicrobium sp. M5D2P9]